MPAPIKNYCPVTPVWPSRASFWTTLQACGLLWDPLLDVIRVQVGASPKTEVKFIPRQ